MCGMIELLGTIATVLAVSGVLLNNRHKIDCFKLWIVSNMLSAIIHWHTATWSLMIRDMIFVALAVEGIVLWRKKKRTVTIRDKGKGLDCVFDMDMVEQLIKENERIE